MIDSLYGVIIFRYDVDVRGLELSEMFAKQVEAHLDLLFLPHLVLLLVIRQFTLTGQSLFV